MDPIHANSQPAEALELEQVWDLRAKVATDQRAIDWDLVDFIDMMLATGFRIGETSAITWPAVDLAAGTVEVRGTVIRIRGAGRLRDPSNTQADLRDVFDRAGYPASPHTASDVPSPPSWTGPAPPPERRPTSSGTPRCP